MGQTKWIMSIQEARAHNKALEDKLIERNRRRTEKQIRDEENQAILDELPPKMHKKQKAFFKRELRRLAQLRRRKKEREARK